MSNTVVGIFEYESDAQEAQNYLLANGFADGDVDIKTASYKSDDTDLSEVANKNRDEDFGDKIGNFFKDLFDGDEEETKRYTEAGKNRTIVTVHAVSVSEAETAAGILDQYGALDVNEGVAGYTATPAYTTPAADALPVNDYAAPTQDYNTSPLTVTDEDPTILPVTQDHATTYPLNNDADITYPTADETSKSLPVIEEELLVGKREIETGGVRLRSRIIERPVQESIRLRQEQVTINRTPVDRIATESDFDTFKEGTIEVKEYAEVPVVSKEARVIQEVSLNKTVEERDEIITDTVRSTEVDVEDLTDEEKLRREGLDL